MPNLNQVNVIGHVTREIELRSTPKGTAVAEIGLAINREWKTESGEKKSAVVFVDVTAWSRLAEVCSQYLTKGSPVFFSGRLDLESWIDKATGQKRHKLKIIAEQMQLLGVNPDAQDSPDRHARTGGNPGGKQAPAPIPGQSAPESEVDEIPF